MKSISQLELYTIHPKLTNLLSKKLEILLDDNKALNRQFTLSGDFDIDTTKDNLLVHKYLNSISVIIKDFDFF